MVRVAREINTKLHIIARTRYVVEIPELTRLGANVVSPKSSNLDRDLRPRPGALQRAAGRDRAPGERNPGIALSSAAPGLPAAAHAERRAWRDAGMHIERIVLSEKAPAVARRSPTPGSCSKTGALILAVRRGESDLATPARIRLAAGDVLIVVGQPQQIKAQSAVDGTEPT